MEVKDKLMGEMKNTENMMVELQSELTHEQVAKFLLLSDKVRAPSAAHSAVPSSAGQVEARVRHFHALGNKKTQGLKHAAGDRALGACSGRADCAQAQGRGRLAVAVLARGKPGRRRLRRRRWELAEWAALQQRLRAI